MDTNNSAFGAWRFSHRTKAPPRVRWHTETPLCFVGSWEPLSFRIRAGYAYTDEHDFAAKQEFSSQGFAAMRASGANAIVLPYGKGFGLSATRAERDELQGIADRARAAGLRIGAYINATTAVTETIAADNRDAPSWVARNSSGATSHYHAQQTWRNRICFMRPDAMHWFEQVISTTVQELAPDFLHFDALAGVAAHTANNCACDYCQESFRRWLELRFPTAGQLEAVLGMADIAAIRIPALDPSAPLPRVVSSPDLQLYIRYLLDKELAWIRHLRHFTRSLNQDLAMTGNPGWNRTAGGRRWFARPLEAVLPWLDAVWVEDEAHLEFDGRRIRSRIATFKAAREYSIPVCHYHWQTNEPEVEASLALSLAANAGNLSCLGFSFRYLPHFSLGADAKARFAAWAAGHWQTIGNTRPVGEFAVLRHHDSILWNEGKPKTSVLAVEDLLVAMRVTWRVFARIEASLLAQVRTLVLPDSECLADLEIAVLKTWVRQGGRLLFTPGTASHNENRRRRPGHGLLGDLPGFPNPERKLDPAVVWHHWLRNDFTEFETSDAALSGWKPTIRKFGRGWLGLWPEIQSPAPAPRGTRAQFSGRGSFEAFLRRLHGPLDLQIDGPSSLLVEANFQPRSSELLIHLLRVDPKPGTIRVRLERSAGWQQNRLLSPDKNRAAAKTGRGKLEIAGLERYAVIAVPVAAGQIQPAGRRR